MLKLRKTFAMSRKRQLTAATLKEEETDEKQANAVIKILQSSTCRRLFSWGGSGSKGAMPCELTEEARAEQMARWNFDFQTETPLPGRYQWERTSDSKNNNNDEPPQKRLDDGAEKRKKRRPQSIKCGLRKGQMTKKGDCDKSLSGTKDIHHTHVDIT